MFKYKKLKNINKMYLNKLRVCLELIFLLEVILVKLFSQEMFLGESLINVSKKNIIIDFSISQGDFSKF